jgi:DNA polymerase-1
MIGTVAKDAEKRGFQVYMVTPDKDYGQLISPNIFQYKPGKSGNEHEIIDVAKVCEKYNIHRPEQVIEILTICGDSSDNVPGVKGVGEVGAGKLISKYGTVENIYSHIDELTPKQREAFENSRGHIRLSHTLVTIKTDIPVEIDEEAMRVDCVYDTNVADLFEKYEFGSLKKYLGNVQPTIQKEEKTAEWKTASHAEISKAVKSCGKCAVLTEGEDVPKLTIAVNNLAAEGSIADFAQILTDPEIEKYGYNLKQQRNILASKGIILQGRLMDIELMHYLVNPEKSHKIDILSRSYLNINMEESITTPKEEAPLSLFDEVPEEETTPSRFAEVVITGMLGEVIWKEMADMELQELYLTMEEPLLKVLSDMEMEGVKIDLTQLRRYAAGLTAQMNEIQDRIREMAGEPELNILSPKQIGVLLFEKLNLDPKIKPKKGVRYTYPTDEETLSALADRHHIINEILEYRGIRKLLSTYIEPFPTFISPQTGKVHTTFNQALTATGRLSSSKPNLQNIPIRTERGKEIRKAFVPSRPDGVIVSADYSQIELRVLSHLANDSAMLDAFERDADIHTVTAASVFGVPTDFVTPEMRRAAKAVNFGIVYGISDFSLAQDIKTTKAKAKQYIESYLELYSGVREYMKSVVENTKETGYAVTLSNRRRYIPEIKSSNFLTRSFGERAAMNMPLQGSSADIIKVAMIKVYNRLKQEKYCAKLIMQVHDELIIDCPENERDEVTNILQKEMENAVSLQVPLTVEIGIGKTWFDTKE